MELPTQAEAMNGGATAKGAADMSSRTSTISAMMHQFKASRLATLLVVCALAIAACGSADPEDSSATADPSDSSGATETAAVEVEGDALSFFAQPDEAEGQKAPSFSTKNLDGDAVEYSADDGVARLYVFFAHWCPHCQAEIPQMTTWLNENPLPDNVEVVAISTSVDSSRDNYPPSAWFEAEAWPEAAVADDDQSVLATSFGLSAFPFSVAVDSSGTVLSRNAGGLTEDAYLELIEQLAQSVSGPGA